MPGVTRNRIATKVCWCLLTVVIVVIVFDMTSAVVRPRDTAHHAPLSVNGVPLQVSTRVVARGDDAPSAPSRHRRQLRHGDAADGRGLRPRRRQLRDAVADPIAESPQAHQDRPPAPVLEEDTAANAPTTPAPPLEQPPNLQQQQQQSEQQQPQEPPTPPARSSWAADALHPDADASNLTFSDALAQYRRYLDAPLPEQVHNKEHLQETASYQDIKEVHGHGVLTPHSLDDDGDEAALERQWRACDTTDTAFTDDRDALCQAYLRNWNNMHSIKAMGSRLLSGRTIKFRIFYRHGNITAIVKVSQHKFVYEPVSEILAFGIERAIGWSRVPPTVWTPLPLAYMEAAAGLVSPLFAQWLRQFVVDFTFLDPFRFACADAAVAPLSAFGRRAIDERGASATSNEPTKGDCVNVTLQLWMEDVHPALHSYLAVAYESDQYFYDRFYVPRQGRAWPPSEHRMVGLADLCDRFIFDFITGNTDRGMNDHNNFVYGGCDGEAASCRAPEEPWRRTKGAAKYAFLDQGSSFYSHKEPEHNPFTGGNRTICRFSRTTHQVLKGLARTPHDVKHRPHARPLVAAALARVPAHEQAFRLVHLSVFKTAQDRVDKVVGIIEGCVASFSEDEVLAFP